MGYKERKTIGQKAKDFMTANMWMLWIAVIASIAWDVTVDTRMQIIANDTSKKVTAAADKISRGIILLDLLGRPIVADPKTLSPINPAFKNAILGYVRLYGVYDWATITSNYHNDIDNLDDLYKFNDSARLFKEEFFEPDSPASKDFDAYMTKNIYLIAQNKLPESISIIDQKISDFKVKGQTFYIKIDFTVQAREFNIKTDKYKLREGHIHIEAQGELDPVKGTATNPLGIRFVKQYSPSILEKKVF